MALTIHPNSPISATTGTYYTNQLNPKTQLFLYDSSASSNLYSIIRKEGTKYKFVFTGKATGFYDITYGYLYKFDFSKFIRYNKIDTTTFNVGTYYSYLYGNNSCDLTLAVGDVIANNLSKVDIYSNGEVWLKTSYTPTDLVATKYRYTFFDRVDSIGYYKPDKVIPNTWYPITLYSGGFSFSIIGTNGTSIYGNGFAVSPTNTYQVGFIKLPADFRSVQFAYNGTALPELYKTDICTNPVYFMDKWGNFDALYATGTRNEKLSNERNDIIVNGVPINKDLTTTRSIVQNTGLGISDAQMRGLFSANSAYMLEGGQFKEYLLSNNEWTGYNGVSLGNKNIELEFVDPVQHKRITNKIVSFLD